MKNEFIKLSRKSSISVAEDVVEANMVEEIATSSKATEENYNSYKKKR